MPVNSGHTALGTSRRDTLYTAYIHTRIVVYRCVRRRMYCTATAAAVAANAARPACRIAVARSVPSVLSPTLSAYRQHLHR